jgi:cellulose synthase (UDP-forming)
MMVLRLLSYLLFPTAVLGSLLLLKSIFYKHAGAVNDNFNRPDRSSALKNITRGSIVFSITVFVLIQFVRFRIYYELRNAGGFARHNLIFFLECILFTILLFAELLVMAQLLGNLFYSWLSVSRYRAIPIQPLKGKAPAVAVLVPTCNEDPDVLIRSISSVSRLDYPNLQAVIIENSRDARSKQAAHQIADQYGVPILDAENRGTKASALNAAEALLKDGIQYLAVFDADQRVETQMISDLIPLFEENPRLGWVQTAQLYESDGSLLNCAVSQTSMQSYDNLLEAFSVLGCTFCYGTNFIIRREALKEVGGWDVNAGTALTEDLSTSFLLHQLGWQSLYVRRAYAEGIAPPTLEAFWRQQRRWATGTTYLFLKFVKYFLGGKLRRTRLPVLTAYAVALSYYTSLLALSLLVAWPTLILISYLFSPYLFVATTTLPSSQGELSTVVRLFTSLYPFYVLAAFFPYVNMKLRGYRVRNMLLVQSLLILSAPEYIKGVRDAFFNRLPASFTVTEKTAGTNARNRPLFLMPQFYTFLVLVLTGAMMAHLVAMTPSNYVMWIILFWLFMNSVSLGHLFIFKYEEMAT